MVFSRRMNLWVVCAWCGMLALLSACGGASANGTQGASKVIQVVAAENFYGSLASQLGGSHVAVTSILSDPNVDPHEYQANTSTAIKVGKADLVIENSGGYDSWMDHILEASPNSNRLVIKGFDLAPTKLPDNEHVWYSFDNAEAIARAIVADYKKIDVAHSATFEANLQTFIQSLQPLQQKIADLKQKYNGTPVGLTETIYLYQTQPIGLNVLTPFEFEKSIAEGNDPPAASVIAATDQITKHQIKVLIFNEQTVTPVTTNLVNLAQTQGIPTVGVTETMPPGKTYQSWMMAQLDALEQALGKSK